ncbi:MAG: HAD family hydrolase [Candidatus Omnitrophota bacterium]|jgi:phosphoglycolate phosphatase-like HAD superfamily hydrolase|nr:MAG: HAD family hydrolase [Candidatus Omnitrophota bacterium]
MNEINADTKRYLPNSQIEIINDAIERGHVRHVVFDFDGTLSLIREGWQQVMIPMGVEILLETKSGESEQELYDVVNEFVTRLTGKQTIYQMIELANEVEKRGGKPKDALEYKRMYLDRLWTRIKHRVEGLKNGVLDPIDFVVPGSYDLLEALKERGVTMYLASGTDLPYVQDESSVLNVSRYFGPHIYGALDNYKDFSKRMIIQKIIKDNHLSGPQLLTFGDGYVEIEDTKVVDGIAVGVPTDEVGKINVDEWKRNRLIQAGADMIIPHYRECDRLMAYLFNEE